MPWYGFNTPQGQKQLFANTTDEAAKVYFQQTGITVPPAQIMVGEQPFPGMGFLTIGSGGSGGLDGGTTPPAGATTPPDIRADRDEGVPLAAFRSGLRARGYEPEGPLGGLLDQQLPTSKANFDLSRYLEGAFPGDIPTTSFRDYTAGRGPNASSDALALYNQVQGGGAFSQASLRDALNNAGISDTEEQERFRQNFGQVARGAARGRYGPSAARFLPSQATLGNKFNDLLFSESERGTSARGVSLLDFLKGQYGF